MKSRCYLIIAIIIVVMAGALYFVLRQPAIAPITPADNNSEEPVVESVRKLLAAKYPNYAQTLSVKISQGAVEHARGNVSFMPGAPGGIFLAAKVNAQWQLVHDGNGQIPCALSSYGFPAEMLADCAK